MIENHGVKTICIVGTILLILTGSFWVCMLMKKRRCCLKDDECKKMKLDENENCDCKNVICDETDKLDS